MVRHGRRHAVRGLGPVVLATGRRSKQGRHSTALETPTERPRLSSGEAPRGVRPTPSSIIASEVTY